MSGERRRERFVVDAMNVIGSRPDGWWRDRAGASRRLLGRLAAFAEAEGAELTVVLDGRALPDFPEGWHGEPGGVEVLYARRRGRGAADDRIEEYVAASEDPGSLVVVTSDRGLAGRVRAHGAAVMGARTFLGLVEESEGGARGREAEP